MPILEGLPSPKRWADRVGAVKVIGVIRSKETQVIEIDAASYEEGRAGLDAQVPEGWQLQFVRTEK